MKKSIIYTMLLLFLAGCGDGKKINSKTEENTAIVQKDIIEEISFVEDLPSKRKEIESVKINIDSKKIKPFRFTKGIYLSAYTVASSRFKTILDTAKVAGINTVVFDLKNMNGDVFFSVPQKDEMRQDRYINIINIPRTVKALHEHNMRAVSRIVMFHDQFSAKMDSTLRAKSVEGKSWKENERRKASWLDSSNSSVQEDLLYLIEQAARSGVDEIQLDYVRFPTGGKLSNAVFQFMEEDEIYAASDSNYVKRTKPDIIEDFVRRAKEICDKYEVTLAADVFAIVAWQNKTDVSNTGQNISKLTQYLDMIHPMIYSSHFAENFGHRKDVPNEPYYIMYKGTKLTQKYSNSDCRVVPYIQSNSWKVNYSAEYIYGQIEAIKEAGGEGYILWNASCRYEKTLGWIKNYN